MNISPLSPNLINLLNNDTYSSAAKEASEITGLSFGDMLAKTFETAASTDTADKASGLELLAGQSGDMASLLIDAQKAELSLNLALQIRNKILDAYDEIMRMQV